MVSSSTAHSFRAPPPPPHRADGRVWDEAGLGLLASQAETRAAAGRHTGPSVGCPLIPARQPASSHPPIIMTSSSRPARLSHLGAGEEELERADHRVVAWSPTPPHQPATQHDKPAVSPKGRPAAGAGAKASTMMIIMPPLPSPPSSLPAPAPPSSSSLTGAAAGGVELVRPHHILQRLHSHESKHRQGGEGSGPSALSRRHGPRLAVVRYAMTYSRRSPFDQA